jgi:hypothetical protein
LDADEEATLTEITILADGRICLFGTSAPILAALAEVCPADVDFQRRVEHLRAVGQSATKEDELQEVQTHE